MNFEADCQEGPFFIIRFKVCTWFFLVSWCILYWCSFEIKLRFIHFRIWLSIIATCKLLRSTATADVIVAIIFKIFFNSWFDQGHFVTVFSCSRQHRSLYEYWNLTNLTIRRKACVFMALKSTPNLRMIAQSNVEIYLRVLNIY